jgi:CDP-paratose 2-epimerase
MGKVDQGVVALWVLRHYFNQPLKYIGYGGSGNQVRDVLHVDDLCELVEEQLANFDRWDGWLGNVGGGRDNSVSLQELTAVCRDIVGRKTEMLSETATRQADLRIFLADCRKLFQQTQWRPRRDVRRIAADIYEWARANEADLKKMV